ncbi:MAG: hypothetical protein V4691_01290 [Pseudomonadota bacterium]
MQQIVKANGDGELFVTKKWQGAKFNSARIATKDLNREALLQKGIDYDYLIIMAKNDGYGAYLSSKDIALECGSFEKEMHQLKGIASDDIQSSFAVDTTIDAEQIEKFSKDDEATSNPIFSDKDYVKKSELINLMARKGVLPRTETTDKDGDITFKYDASAPLTETNIKLLAKTFNVNEHDTIAASKTSSGKIDADKAMGFILKKRVGKNYDPNKIPAATFKTKNASA